MKDEVVRHEVTVEMTSIREVWKMEITMLILYYNRFSCTTNYLSTRKMIFKNTKLNMSMIPTLLFQKINLQSRTFGYWNDS